MLCLYVCLFVFLLDGFYGHFMVIEEDLALKQLAIDSLNVQYVIIKTKDTVFKIIPKAARYFGFMETDPWKN